MVYIPKRINVGYQNRADTYTGKLAYIIYYDNKGKLRKEPSWNNWRDQSIPNDEFDNEPTEGFVLNKRVGGVEDSYGYNARITYTRIYDPRGFEFEITISNLLWILENCNCIKGKGLEGEFVYGWDGTDLLLIPIDSPEYKTYKQKSDVINSAEYLTFKDLKLGFTYYTVGGEGYVYLGRYDRYVYNHKYNVIRGNHINFSYVDYEGYVDEPQYMSSDFPDSKIRTKVTNKGKHYYFMCLNNSSEFMPPELSLKKSVTKCFISSSETVHKDYQNFINQMESDSCFSEIDFERVGTVKISLEDFTSCLNETITKANIFNPYYWLGEDNKAYTIYYDSILNGFTLNKIGNYSYNAVKFELTDVAQIYYQIKPVYKIFYLKNGREYLRRFDNGIK